MDPFTLEGILMLRINKDLWDEVAIQNVLIKAKQEKAARKLKRNCESEDDTSKINSF